MAERYRKYGAILVCGGRGTRLEPVTRGKIPKPLINVGGRELVLHSIEHMSPGIVEHVVFAVGHQADQIENWVQRQNLPHAVHYTQPIKTGILDSIATAANEVQDDGLIACNTDEVRSGLNLAAVIAFHEKHGRLATMVTAPADRLNRHRLVRVRSRDNLVTSTRLKPKEFERQPGKIGLVNTGLIVMERGALEHLDPGYSGDWPGIIDPLCDAGQLFTYIDPEIVYFNVGTPEEFKEAKTYLLN